MLDVTAYLRHDRVPVGLESLGGPRDLGRRRTRGPSGSTRGGLRGGPDPVFGGSGGLRLVERRKIGTDTGLGGRGGE